MRIEGSQRLRLDAASIRASVDRLSHLPTILSLDPEIKRMLANPTPEAVLAANLRLEAINAAAQSANLYVMAPDGMTVAASNWRSSESYVGSNYGLRTYFLDARARGTGRLFAVGLTTHLPGYFVAAAIKDHNAHVLGVAVVKIDLERLERDWAQASEAVLVSDQNGVAILTSVPGWRYTVKPTTDEGLMARISQARRYGSRGIRQLDITEVRVLDPQTRLVSISGTRYIAQRQSVPGEDWQIEHFTDWDAIQPAVRGAALMAGLAWTGLVLLVLYVHQRRLAIRTRAQAQADLEHTLRQARDELERTVARRTLALTAEIAEHEKTEQNLRAIQDELVHAGKMAALGQMSAAMAHEINQPLTALRTYLASTRIFMERGDLHIAAANFDMMTDLADRLARITQHLKVFARKSPVRPQVVDLREAITRALLLLEGQLCQAEVEVETDLVPAHVVGDPLRFEQVFVNLVRNAIDAMRSAPVRRLEIGLTLADEVCTVRVSDTGSGLVPDSASRLFEPFFTTKEVGEGLGLGLSLSYGIIHDAGGEIAVDQTVGFGAAFVIRLPLARGGAPPGSA